MPKKKKTTRKRASKSLDIKALTKEAGVLYEHVQDELKRLGVKYDLKNMSPKTGKAAGDGYFFVIAKSHSIQDNSDFRWGQSNYNFPVAAIVATLDQAAQATVKMELLNLFAQNLGRQFQEQYGEDFAEAITLHFYEFLEKEFGGKK